MRKHRSRRGSRSVLGAAVLVLVIVVAGAGAASVVGALVEGSARARYDARYAAGRTAAIDTIETGVERYAKVLHGAAGLLNASEQVQPDEFRRYGQAIGLPHSDPGMDVVGVLRPVAWADRLAAAIELATIQPGARLTITDERPHELVISALTTDPTSNLIGYDVGADPARRIALDRARDSGTAAMTSPVIRVADQQLPRGRQQASFVLYVPVYRTPTVPSTVAARRTGLVAWTSTAVRLGDMLHALGLDRGAVAVALLGSGDRNGDVLASTTTPGRILHDRQVRFTTVDVAGQRWRLAFSPGATLGSAGDGWWATTIVGLSVTLAVAIVVGFLLTQRSRLRRRVDEAVADLAVTNEQLEQETDLQRALIANLGVGVLAVDIEGNARAFNLIATGPGMAALRRSDRQSWSEFFGLFDPETGDPLRDEDSPIDRALRGERIQAVELLVRQEGVERNIRCNAQPVLSAAGDITGAVCTVHDITDLRAENALLSARANTDGLTGLANRAAVCERLERLLADAGASGTRVGLLYLDLDRFKPINDTFGHEVGDKLLQVLARRLHGAVRPTDLAARLGGDEFVVVCEDLEATGGIERLAERLRIVLAQPFVVGNRQLQVSASVGCVRSRPRDDAASLLDRADREMYEAKRRSRADDQVATATSRSTKSMAPASD